MFVVDSGRDLRTVADQCAACGAEVTGYFCASCGQRNRLPTRPLSRLLRDAISDGVAASRRFFRSLGTLITKPGQLTLDYLKGLHLEHIGPVRLFVNVGVGAFMLTRFLPSELDLFGVGPTLFGEQPSLGEWLAGLYGVAAAAVAHWLVLRRRRPFFVESATFVLHVTAFSFILAPIGGLLAFLGSTLGSTAQVFAELAPPLALAVYWILALRRFNESDRQQNALDVLLIYASFVVLAVPLALLDAF